MSKLAKDVSDGDQPQHIPLVEALQLRPDAAVKHLWLILKQLTYNFKK